MSKSPDVFYINSFSEDDDIFFSRAQFLEEIIAREKAIQCVVFSTYRLSLNTLIEEFPVLFSPLSTISTFVLHGDNIFVEERIVDGKLIRIARRSAPITVPSEDTDDEEETLHDALPEEDMLPLPASVVIAEVAPQTPRYIDATGSMKRNMIMGVHHAKYMLVFVETGVYVAISSGNVSAQLSLDATWTQYFRRTERSVAQTNDFGEVLEDFLSHQADQILVRHCDSAPREVPNLMSWLRLNLKLGKGRSLASMFDWNAASVDLVTTVPGSDRQFMSQDELKDI